MGKSQDKLKEELRQLCDEEKYYEAARLLVLIEDAEDIDFLVERLALDWLWNLKDVDDETWSYAFFLDGFCNEFGAYGWRDSNMPLAVYNYRRSYELGNRYAAVRLAACYEKGVPDNSEKEKWLLKAAEGGLPQAQCELGVHYFDMAKGEEASIAESQRKHGNHNCKPESPEETEASKRCLIASLKWFRLAAEQEDELAQCYFRLLYPRIADDNILSLKETVMWLEKVASSDSPHKKDIMEHLEKWRRLLK